MATVTAFDKVNRLRDAAESQMTYEQFFGEMDLTDEQKRKRIQIAEDIEDDVMIFFLLYALSLERNVEVDHARAVEELKENLRKSLELSNIQMAVIMSYLVDVVDEEARVTAERYRDDPYWTSDERAKTIARNDANTVMFSQEFQDAVASGMTGKRWVTMGDERVRKTHVAVDGEIVPINDPFVVGNSLLLYPRDMSLNPDPDEVVNCRCSVSYLRI